MIRLERGVRRAPARAGRFALPCFVLLAAFGCGPRPSPVPDASVTEPPDAGETPDAGPEHPEPFTLRPFENVRIASHSDQPNFQRADAPFDWGTGPKASVKLVVDLDTTCYPFEKWSQNPPPAGHNWPSDCDAYDRTFTFTLDPATEAGEPPGLELVRAITPFGGPLHFEIDVTDLANGLPGTHLLRTRIETWSDGAGQVSGSDGGWFVSARFEVVPGKAPASVAAVIPLAQTTQTTSGEGGTITFTLPPGTVETRLEYRVTGHGGTSPAGDPACIGGMDEFCRRQHELKVDGAVIGTFTPWRSDCADLCTLAQHTWPSGGTFTYCQENPCGAQQSVRAPRANWCPGSLTPPFVFHPDALAQGGEHTFTWDIQKVGAGGSWAVSAHLIVYGTP